MIPDFRPDSKCINLPRIANRNNHRLRHFRSITLIFAEMVRKVLGYTCNNFISCVLHEHLEQHASVVACSRWYVLTVLKFL